MANETTSFTGSFTAADVVLPGAGPSQTDVLVVGGGPTGLMMATELLRHGVRVRCIDKMLKPQPFAKASGVWPRSLEIFDQKGIGERFLEHSIQAKHFMMYDQDKRPIINLDVQGLPTRFCYLMGIEQYTTEALLTAHLHELGGRIERGISLESWEENADGILATLRADDGTVELLQAKYLTGCDGAHSTVRHGLGLEFAGEKYPCQYVLGHMQVEWELPDEQVYLFLGEEGAVFAAPLPHNRWFLVGELAGDQTSICHEGSPTLHDLHEVFASRLPVKVRFSELQWSSFFALHHRMVGQYQQGRVFLAGDAGHIHSPVGGQGMNTGMQDAHNLAWKLAYVCRGWANESLLESYHAERHPVAEHVLGLTDRIQRSLNLRGKTKMRVRNALMHTVGRLEFVRSNAVLDMSETAYTYKHGPLADECRHASVWPSGDNQHPGLRDSCCFRQGPRAGDRAPDVELKDCPADWLSHLWRSSKVIMLLFEGLHDGDEAIAREDFEHAATFLDKIHGQGWIEPWVVVRSDESAQSIADLGFSILNDYEGTVHERYGAASGCAFMIRPDGHVLCRTLPIDMHWIQNFLQSAGLGQESKVHAQ